MSYLKLILYLIICFEDAFCILFEKVFDVTYFELFNNVFVVLRTENKNFKKKKKNTSIINSNTSFTKEWNHHQKKNSKSFLYT